MFIESCYVSASRLRVLGLQSRSFPRSSIVDSRELNVHKFLVLYAVRAEILIFLVPLVSDRHSSKVESGERPVLAARAGPPALVSLATSDVDREHMNSSKLNGMVRTAPTYHWS